AGQCAKLKCCLNYEVDCYVEAQKHLPLREVELETKDATFFFCKADILNNQITYSTDKNFLANAITISGKRAFEIIGLNRKGIKPDNLLEESDREPPKKQTDLLEQESLTRFDNHHANDRNNNNQWNNKKKKKNHLRETQASNNRNSPQANNHPFKQK
ncbi:hypothetical protein EZS27_040356, partial [termite gut metagenome]